jgi:hypothetical protein
MEKDDFLVTTTVNGKSWQMVWDNEEPLELDHPVFWELRNGDHGVILYHKTDGRKYAIAPEHLNGQQQVSVPASPGEERQISLEFKRLHKIRPAFMPNLKAMRELGAADYYLSSGIREYLIGFKPIEGQGFTATVEDQDVFEILNAGEVAQIVAKRPGVRFKLMGQGSKVLPVGGTFNISPNDLVGGAFIFGSYWWRINKVATPEMMDLDELEQELKEQDLIPLRSLGKSIGAFVLVAVIIMRGLYYTDLFHDKKVHTPPPVAEVELKKPKIIPAIVPPPPPKIVKKEPEKKKEPPKIAKKEPPKKKEPVKVAKKEPPKKKQPPKIAKHEAPKHKAPAPPVVAKAVPKPHVAPKPAPTVAKHVAPAPPTVAKHVAPAPPVPKAPPAPDPAVVAAQQRAKEKADEKASVAKSLNFLSSGPSKNVSALGSTATGKDSAKYGKTGSGGVPASDSELSKMAKENSGSDGPISTRGSRGIASNSGISGGHGKGLNEVQGKVSLGALYGSGSGEALGAAAGDSGTTVTGPGKLADSAIEKTLARYLQKFQYCYEKALLTDSTLAGTIQMQWTIGASGNVSGAEVVRSAMNNAGLHSCLKRELSKIHFPSPSGGEVTVKKPFSFQSTSL